MYPLVRPKNEVPIKSALMRFLWLKYVTLFKKKYVVYPEIGKIVCFLGNQNLHGVFANKKREYTDRISVQFAFNFTNKNVQAADYYGE